MQRQWISQKNGCEPVFHVPTACCSGEFGTSQLLEKGGLCYLYSEGRNGVLSQIYQNGRGLSSNRLAALTSIFTERSEQRYHPWNADLFASTETPLSSMARSSASSVSGSTPFCQAKSTMKRLAPMESPINYSAMREASTKWLSRVFRLS